jgi:hypothetical protein
MPCASLVLEWIGFDTYQEMKGFRRLTNEMIPGAGDRIIGTVPASAWVAELRGRHHKYTFERSFLRGKIDYSKANSKGSRGVEVHFVLYPGKYYEVSNPTSWRRTDRYFCRVTDDGEIVRIDRSEVLECLKSDLSDVPY